MWCFGGNVGPGIGNGLSDLFFLGEAQNGGGGGLAQRYSALVAIDEVTVRRAGPDLTGGRPGAQLT